MIKFNVLLQTFANILINTEWGKKEKHVGIWVKQKLLVHEDIFLLLFILAKHTSNNVYR